MILLEGLLTVAVFLLVLGGLILVHEMGHYLAGRLQGFAIEAFSIGFGPRLAEWRGRYNRWQLRWILMGGFVKFRGESGEEEAPAEGPGSPFFAMARWRRFLVLVMGVAFNVLLAYLLFSGLAYVGVEESLLATGEARVGFVAPGLPADKAGIRAGDVILALGGRKVRTWEEIREEVALNQKPYDVTVRRGGETLTLRVEPEVVAFLKQPVGEIGVYPSLPPVIGAVADPSPALAAGIRPGDRIVSLDGESFGTWDEFQRAMALKGGEPRRFVLEREGRRVEVEVTPRYDEGAGRYLIGVSPQETVFRRYPFPQNFSKAAALTLDQSTLAYRTLRRLVTRQVGLSALSGPVSIAYITGKVARTGLYNLLTLVAVISLQLGFINLLPVPGLDGGQILVLALEGALRRDFPMTVKERILQAGFILLILLSVVVLVLDLAKFVR